MLTSSIWCSKFFSSSKILLKYYSRISCNRCMLFKQHNKCQCYNHHYHHHHHQLNCNLLSININNLFNLNTSLHPVLFNVPMSTRTTRFFRLYFFASIVVGLTFCKSANHWRRIFSFVAVVSTAGKNIHSYVVFCISQLNKERIKSLFWRFVMMLAVLY